MGLLKKGLSAFRQRGGQNDASGSSATAAVTDGRFCVKPQVGSKTGFFNSPTVSRQSGDSPWDSHRALRRDSPRFACPHQLIELLAPGQDFELGGQ